MGLLFAAGADVNQQTFSGSTPLHAAAKAGHADSCTFLMEQGANKEAVDADGFSPDQVATGGAYELFSGGSDHARGFGRRRSSVGNLFRRASVGLLGSAEKDAAAGGRGPRRFSRKSIVAGGEAKPRAKHSVFGGLFGKRGDDDKAGAGLAIARQRMLGELEEQDAQDKALPGDEATLEPKKKHRRRRSIAPAAAGGGGKGHEKGGEGRERLSSSKGAGDEPPSAPTSRRTGRRSSVVQGVC